MSAGGTGGHISPALAVVTENQASPTPASSILWVGTAGEMEEKLVPRAGLPLETISGGGLHGVGVIKFFQNGLRLVQGWRQARRIIRRFRPDVVFLTGGYTNAPVAMAAWEKRIPMLIFLPDIEPGLAIKTLSRFVTAVACTDKASLAFLPKARVTGYPVRPDLVPEVDRDQARTALNLSQDQKTLLVFGGSRGARTINNALIDILPELLADYQVIHITGELDWKVIEEKTAGLNVELRERYHLYPYLHEEMGLALRAADLVVSRAGAATMGEFPAFSLPAILIPYPFAWRYQKVNADYLAAQGAAIRMNDEDMAAELLPTIRRVLGNEEKLESMRAASLGLSRPDAARQISDLLVELARRDSQ